jgi:hypothetical protein
MSYEVSLSDWRSSLVDGWVQYSDPDLSYYDWEPRLAGGFWQTHIEIYSDGIVEGVSYISGNISASEALIISGYCIGIGTVNNRFNFSRRKALYPELRRDLTYDWNDAPVAAIEYVDFSPNKVLHITSYEDSLYENTSDFYLIETLSGNLFFPIYHYPYSANSSGLINYLITDIKSQGQNGEPLFYQYELLFDLHTLEDGTVATVYKNNETKIDPSQYLIQFSYDLLSDGNDRYSTTTWGTFDRSKSVHRVRLLLPIDFASPEDFYTIDYNKSVYGSRTPQKELVELESLYSQGTDFTIVESGLQIPLLSGNIDTSINSLYIVKDPSDRIRPIRIEPPAYQPDKISSWRLRLNPGSLLTRSGIYNNENETFFFVGNPYANTYYPITNVKPVFISENIIKVDQFPIFIDETQYTFPDYTIELYDKKELQLATDPGKVSIEVNGTSRTDIKIHSIDRKKGFLQLSEALDQTDELELNFYVYPSGHVILENLELNPKIRSDETRFHISGFMDGLAVAVKEYDPSDSNTEFMYIYDTTVPSGSRIYYKVPGIGEPTIAYTSGTFYTICEIDVNRLSTNDIKITDARRTGGGIRDTVQLSNWFSENSGINPHELESYLGNAYYGGDPQSFGSTVIIHIPSGMIEGSRRRWIDSLSGYVEDSLEQVERGTREFNFYLDQVIKRFISAGTDYIIIPINSSGNFGDILDLNNDN